MQIRDDFEERVQAELASAIEHHGPMASGHEAYAVILEELEEWWDEVKDRNHLTHRRDAAVRELVQLAAMVRRAAHDVYGLGVPWAQGPAADPAYRFDAEAAAALDRLADKPPPLGSDPAHTLHVTEAGRRAVEALNRAADTRKDRP